jgi:cytochrome P450 family 142 subfamily A polypeptide 1
VTPLNNMFRTAVSDTQINGSPVRAGDRLALLYPAANRDPDVFSDAQRFDVGRDPNRHLAFGHGTHFCLGANLARLELRLLLEHLVPRITHLEVVDGPVVEANVFARAVSRLELSFDERDRSTSS